MSRDSRTVYLFDGQTSEFKGEGVAWASPSSKEPGMFHMPACSTIIKPPAIEPGQAAVWRGDRWAVVPDLRGTRAYDTDTGAPAIVEALGPLPDNRTATPRPDTAHVFVDGAWREDPALKAELVADRRAAAGVTINGRAEATRLRFITGGDGQALVYTEKRSEAERYLALAQEPEDFTDYPLIRAEVLRTGAPAKNVATLWIGRADAWRRAAAAIETIRLDAHDAIAAAADLAAIDLAIDAAVALFDNVAA